MNFGIELRKNDAEDDSTHNHESGTEQEPGVEIIERKVLVEQVHVSEPVQEFLDNELPKSASEPEVEAFEEPDTTTLHWIDNKPGKPAYGFVQNIKVKVYQPEGSDGEESYETIDVFVTAGNLNTADGEKLGKGLAIVKPTEPLIASTPFTAK